MYLGFDTSNYTTSVAAFDGTDMIQKKQILSVKEGEKGLRQSDAVFQHTVNIPNLINQIDFAEVDSVAVSTKPRSFEGSYMPCFLVGKSVACAVASTNSVPLYETSHQNGHILASLYGANKLDLVNDKFIAFHLSGGTTEALIVQPDAKEIIKCNLVASSSDLKAGQAIDRTGVMLGFKFPCGKQLDELSLLSDAVFKVKPSVKDFNCSLSGVENKAQVMYSRGEQPCDIAKFVLTYIAESIGTMLSCIVSEYGNMPVVFSGGVSSNTILRNTINNKFDAVFAPAEYSLDNAAGVAIYGYLKNNF